MSSLIAIHRQAWLKKVFFSRVNTEQQMALSTRFSAVREGEKGLSEGLQLQQRSNSKVKILDFLSWPKAFS